MDIKNIIIRFYLNQTENTLEIPVIDGIEPKRIANAVKELCLSGYLNGVDMSGDTSPNEVEWMIMNVTEKGRSFLERQSLQP